MTTKKMNKMKKGIRNFNQAEEFIAELLESYASGATRERLNKFAKKSKQSTKEIARRTASNILRHFKSRKNAEFLNFDF